MKLPARTYPYVDAIYQYHEAQNKTEAKREYLGASAIGETCKRKSWYDFRWYVKSQYDGRLLRLFRTGHLQESRVYEELHAIGLTVDGEQDGFKLFGGHFRGHCDGVIDGDMLLEIKTHSQKNFLDLEAKGVQASKITHYKQMQAYMGALNLSKGLYFAVNKNTDEIYTEIVLFNEAVYRGILRDAKQIIFSDEPLPRISENPAYYECKWCPFREICHLGAEHEKNYRNDGTHKPAEDGTWQSLS